MEPLRVVCAVIQDREGQYFICQRPLNKVHGGLWEFPGGKVKNGESEEDALNREIQEELAAQILIEEKLPESENASGSIRLLPYKCRLKEAEGIELQEHSNSAWVTKDEILKYSLAEADIGIARNLRNI